MAAQAFTGLAVPNPAGLAMSNYSDTDYGMGPNLGHGLGNPIPPQQPSFTSSFYSDRTAPHLATKSPTLQGQFEEYFENKPLLSNYLDKLRKGYDANEAFGELLNDMVNHVSKGRPGGQQLKNELESFYFKQINPKARQVLEHKNDPQRKNTLYRALLKLAEQINNQLAYRNSGVGHGGRKIARNYSSRNGKKTSLRKLNQRSRKHKTRTKTKKT